tara:strand:+ start:67 stop:555 length:489 start_codon:yes stop_codon:yes gene_type:complete
MKKFFPDIEVVRPNKHVDNRGEIWTNYEKSMFINNATINHTKYSTSKKGVLRGFHGDFKTSKIVTCIYGEIFFVVIDNRKDSKTYMHHDQMLLNDVKRDIVFISPGFANGFCVLSDYAIFSYVLSYEGEYADAKDQFTLKWDDPNIGVKWPIENPILSERDK